MKNPSESKYKTDFLIIGSGVAGLSLALYVAHLGKVIVLSKTKLEFCNTALAQGGIAAPVNVPYDSVDKHINDTLVAGAGLCHPRAVRSTIEQATERIQDLEKWGVQFNQRSPHNRHPSKDKFYDLHKEGCHSQRRVLHVGDSTGLTIHQVLLKKALEHPHIEIHEHQFAIDLITNKQLDLFDMSPLSCIGAYVLDKQNKKVNTYSAKITVLSTGGAGKAYLYTSNWDGATGDGIAMAYRAGCRISNMEFMQFHPTCLFHPETRNFLISEAVRGEGGRLIDSSGHPFMKKYHLLGSLAPRDVVARSIDAELKKTGEPCVFLDITRKPKSFLKQKFPVIYQKLFDLGIDISKQPIPVVPAAHYLCGGVLTNLTAETDVKNLFAIGETACTGLHGANRLASNSLLECLSFSHNAAQHIESHWTNYLFSNKNPKPWIYPSQEDADELIVINHIWNEVRTLMWNYVGIVRSNKRLFRAQNRLKNILSEIAEYYSNFNVTSDLLELRNISIVADLTVRCALKRKESIGIHYSLDCPTEKHPIITSSDTNIKDTVLIRGL